MVTTHYVALMIHKDYIYRILLEIPQKNCINYIVNIRASFINKPPVL
jgi:hypothetical protein